VTAGPTGTLPDVGVAGLGAMGSPMTRHLLERGHRVLGFDPDGSAVQRHVARGGIAVSSPRELAVADVVVTSLPSAAALAEVLDLLGSADPARDTPLVVVETSTLALTEKLAARERMAAWPLLLVDCPVSGTSAQAEAGDLVAYYSGLEPWATALVVGVLEGMTRAAYDVGVFGNGTRMKLVANLLVAVHNVAAAEALQLAERSGLDLDLVLAAVGDGAGSSRMLQVRGPMMAERSFEPATARVSIFDKDLRAIRALAGDVGSPTPLLDVTEAIYATAMRQGRADQDAAAVFEVLDGVSGPPA
jgi:putative dehydrogenase